VPEERPEECGRGNRGRGGGREGGREGEREGRREGGRWRESERGESERATRMHLVQISLYQSDAFASVLSF
jgi:hypothetical protein